MTGARPFRVLLLAAAAAVAAPARAEQAEDPLMIKGAQPAGPRWSWNLPIYEVHLERQTEAGTFGAFEQRLGALKDLGVGIVWLMPIHPRSGNPPGKPRSKSPYCVRDYHAVNPRYGTKADFRRLVKAIHAAGMYVILDWVGNHTSWGNKLITEHPEYYRKDKAGKIRQAGPWSDVAQLDYGNRDVWQYMFEARKHWIVEFGVDGFREDVAGMVPVEHWTWLRPRLNRLKPGGVFLLAEAEGGQLHPAFDASYDWTFMPVFWKIAHFDQPATIIDEMLRKERRAYPRGAVRMRHATNHDVCGMGYAWPSRKHIDVEFLEKVPLAEKYKGGERPFAVLCATLPASRPMLWNGQEIGILAKTPRPIPWKASPHTAFYRKLLRLYRDHPALSRGDFAKVPTGRDESVYAFLRRHEADRVLVVANLSDAAVTAALDGPHVAGEYREAFTGRKRSLARGDRVRLDAWAYRVYAQPGPSAATRPAATWRAVHVITGSAGALDALEAQLPALAKLGVNVLICEVNYGFDFQSHPELRPRSGAITKARARRFAAACRRRGIRAIPMLNCIGHQSWKANTAALLTRHPEFDETPGKYPGNKGIYCRSWCTRHPKVRQVVFALVDELLDAFQADAFHVGMDEIFLIGSEHCPRCTGRDPARLLAAAVTAFHKHLKGKGAEMLMWADRLIDGKATGMGRWEAAQNGTAPAADLIPKDIILCPWHYNKRKDYPSIPLLLGKGFRVLPAGWNKPDAVDALIDFSLAPKSPRVLGYMATTWSVNVRGVSKYPPLVRGMERLSSAPAPGAAPTSRP